MIFYQNINRNIRFTEIGNKNETEFYEVKRTMEDKKLQEALKKRRRSERLSPPVEKCGCCLFRRES